MSENVIQINGPRSAIRIGAPGPQGIPGTGVSSVDWSAITGKPLTFTPDDHTHPILEVDGLTEELALKADSVTVDAQFAALDLTIAGKADTIHTQAISTVTGLQAALDLKAPLDNPTLTRAQIATGTITADTPALNITQIWNNASIAFNAINLEITNTASAAASNFIKCQLPSGTTLFKVDKSGFIYGPGAGYIKMTGSAFAMAPAGTVRGGMDASGGFGVSSGGWIGFSSLSAADPSSGLSADVVLKRGGAGILQLKNNTSPQTLHIFGTESGGGTDYERLSLSYNGSAFLIQNEAGGTGLAREVVLNSTSALRFQFSGGTKCIIGSGSTQFYQPVSSTASIISSTWLRPGSYTVAGVPSAASAGAGAQIYITNESGGACLAYSNGTNWKRVRDGVNIS